MSSLALGTVPDWIAAIGTAGALIVGMVVLNRDSRARSDETRRLAASDEQERRRHASQVSGLVVEDRSRVEPSGAMFITNITAIAHNNSGQPIYRVAGEVWDSTAKAIVQTLSFVNALPGGHTSRLDVTGLLVGNPPDVANHWLLTLTFTDSNGIHWRRHVDGRLTELSSGNPETVGGNGVTDADQ